MIPSNDKNITERLALAVLKEYSHKYLHYKRIQKNSFPDLYDSKTNNAVEVTSDLSKENWCRLIKLDSSIYYGNDNRQDTKTAIANKMYKKYEGINEIELFVFTWYIDCENFMQPLLDYIFEQHTKAKVKFLRIFIFSNSLKKLWIFDLETKSVDTYCLKKKNINNILE